MIGRRRPRSLVSGESPEDRRALVAVKTANSPPTGIVGFATWHTRYVHLDIKLLDAGESFKWTLWMYLAVSGEWTKHPNGIDILVNNTTTDGSVLEISGRDRVYIELHTLSVSPLPLGVNAWLAEVNY